MAMRSERTGATDWDITNPETWPPGSMMRYEWVDFTGLGLVVANRNGNVAVLWDAACKDPVKVYSVEGLNPAVISRAF